MDDRVLSRLNEPNYDKNKCTTFGYVLKAPRFTFPADMVRVGSICKALWSYEYHI